MKSAKATLIDNLIKENEDILLASFDLRGIAKSKFKSQKIMEIIKSLSGDSIDNVQLFFEELHEFYVNDKQFIGFSEEQIAKFIENERSFIMVKAVS